MTVLVLATTYGLTACAAPLEAGDAIISATAIAPKDALVGDVVKVAVVGELPDARADEIVLLVETSKDGSNWTELGLETVTGPYFAAKFDVPAEAAGTLAVRASVSTASEEPVVLASSKTSEVTIADIAELIRTHYYNRTQAFSTSPEAGLAFVLENNYPGAFSTPAAALEEQRLAYIDAAATESSVPDLGTITATPEWIIPPNPCNALPNVPPAGRTFIVSVDFADTWYGFPSSARQDVHVTLLDGKLYHYQGGC